MTSTRIHPVDLTRDLADPDRQQAEPLVLPVFESEDHRGRSVLVEWVEEEAA